MNLHYWLARLFGLGNTSRPRNAYCSFCSKSYHDAGPLVEGPREVYICSACIKLCQEIINKEIQRLAAETEN
jgi:ATP-dependent Clp protease ATP-binding subunit ClpX